MKTRSLLCAVAAFLINPAMAEMQIVTHGASASPVVIGQRTEYQTAPVFQHRGWGEASSANGYGKHLELSLVVSQILPKGWIADIDPNYSSKPVSWSSGGERWTDIMQRTLKDNGIDGLVDWYAKKVIIGPRARNLYTLKPTTLHENLAEWSSQAAWTLRYEALREYQVDVGIVIEPGMDFKEAVQLLIGSYFHATPEDAPLQATFYEANRVLVINSKNSLIKQAFE